MALLNFNAQSVAPNSAFDPLPAGWYHVKITDSETKPVNPPKTGSYLALTFEVIEGPYAGRKVFTNLNLENENPTAVKIAFEQLSALCYVTGQIQCQDSQQLHGIPFQAKLSIKPADGQYDASNNVKGFRNSLGQDPKDIATGAAPAGPGAPSAPKPPSPPTAPTAPSLPQAPVAPLAPNAPVSPPAPPAAPPAPPPVVQHDPLAAAEKDGWLKHPQAEGFYYKGQDVKPSADVAALYPAPAAAPTAPAAPPVPSIPQAPIAGTATTPPWVKTAG